MCNLLHLMLCPCLVGQQFKGIRPQLLKTTDRFRQVQVEVVRMKMPSSLLFGCRFRMPRVAVGYKANLTNVWPEPSNSHRIVKNNLALSRAART